MQKKLSSSVNSLKPSNLQIEVLIGTVLGYACIKPISINSFKIKFEQSKYEYILHLSQIFESETDIRLKSSSNKYSFDTISYDWLTYYFNLFYPNSEVILTMSGHRIRVCNSKSIPKCLLKHFTLKSLSYLIMDNGSYNDGKLSINLYAFEIYQVKSFAIFLQNKFDISSIVRLDRQKPRLEFNRIQTEKLVNLVDQFVIDVFKYKLGK